MYTKGKLRMKTDRIKLIRQVVLGLINPFKTLTASIYHDDAENSSGEDNCNFSNITFMYSIKYADKKIIWLA